MDDKLEKTCEGLQTLSRDILRLIESVSTFEADLRQLHSKLGWECQDTDPEGNNCDVSVSISGATYEETDDEHSASPVSNDITAADSCEEQPEERSKTPEEKPKVAEPRRKLTRLPMELRPRCPPRPSTSKRVISDDELSDAVSDYQPSGGSSSSDFSITSSKSDKQKKKKFMKSKKVMKTDATEMPQAAASQPASSVQPLKLEPPAIANGTDGASTSGTASNVKSEMKTETKLLAVSERKPDNALQVPQELKVGMQVLAERKKMRWESGKIAEIVEKEDGRKKFKVIFENKGRVLVSGHHIAYDAIPQLGHMSVGIRVVSKSNSNNDYFSPGVVGELPCRKNHMRFLIFFDDQKTLYVALPAVRLVSMPLLDPLDDIRDEEQKRFMKEYLLRVPYNPCTKLDVGCKVKVERDGVIETCTVSLLDCKLVEVTYAKDEEKEWMYSEHFRVRKDDSKAALPHSHLRGMNNW